MAFKYNEINIPCRHIIGREFLPTQQTHLLRLDRYLHWHIKLLKYINPNVIEVEHNKNRISLPNCPIDIST